MPSATTRELVGDSSTPESVSVGAAYRRTSVLSWHVRVSWEQALAVTPDVVVCAPCGYDLSGSVALAQAVVESGVLPEVKRLASAAIASGRAM